MDFLFAKLENNFPDFQIKKRKCILDTVTNNEKAREARFPQISPSSLGQNGCAYYGKSAYYE